MIVRVIVAVCSQAIGMAWNSGTGWVTSVVEWMPRTPALNLRPVASGIVLDPSFTCTALVTPPRSTSTDDGLVGTDDYHARDVFERRRVLVRDRQDPIARLNSRSCSTRIGQYATDDVGSRRPDQREERREDDDREQEIGRGPGEDDQEALPDRPNLENSVA